MTTIADDFFSLSIATIVEHLKISQSIAGITLMAFGNGANGIFSIIASVVNTKHPKAGLAIGDLLGGGAFVTSVVFGTVILIKPFKIAKFATLRDISVYLIGIGWMAFMMLYDKKLHFWEPAGLFF
uniref:Sodium/calcium exchanger membrane region domain-containing protein n=1 Tax=Panagrolaimus davidi TaxID=227884 RepID=A0A914P8A8_9BILA